MIFNEIYSAYYNTVAKIITAVISGNGNEEELERIVAENAFGESVLTLLPSLKGERWQIFHNDMTTPLKHKPTMPLTLIQKRWLKAVSLDPRMKLFGVEIKGLDDIEPLFTPEDYFVYDKYGDGDPYEDEKYIEHFRTLLCAIHNRQNVKIEMVSRRGRVVYERCQPHRLEYSEKDDKFRLVTKRGQYVTTVNLSRITRCDLYNGDEPIGMYVTEPEYDNLILRVTDERNTLERSLLHFAHFEKRVEREGERYILHIKYQKDDESELVIRVLSFGPTVEVLGSENFKKLIINKLKSQKSCELK